MSRHLKSVIFFGVVVLSAYGCDRPHDGPFGEIQIQGDPPTKPGPTPLPAEITEAWKTAGIDVGWSEPPLFGLPTFRLFETLGWADWQPAFRIKHWEAGMLNGLPDPQAKFALFVTCPQPTDHMLKELARFEHLSTLQLNINNLPGEGLQELANHQQLESLTIFGNNVPVSNLKSFNGIKQLKAFHLALRDTSDVALKDVAQLNRLSGLYLHGKQITFEGLKGLVTLENLRILTLHDINISVESVKELNRLLPKCHIFSQ